MLGGPEFIAASGSLCVSQRIAGSKIVFSI